MLLGGKTAYDAAAADLPLGHAKIEDFYALDESHALLTFIVPRSARVTVVTTRPPKAARSTIVSTRVGVAELAQLLQGRNPGHRAILVHAAAFGYWVRVDIQRGALARCAVPPVTVNLGDVRSVLLNMRLLVTVLVSGRRSDGGAGGPSCRRRRRRGSSCSTATSSR